jgi:hypothetical protein
MRRNDRLHLFDKLSYVCGVIREETVTEQKYCDRYQNIHQKLQQSVQNKCLYFAFTSTASCFTSSNNERSA